MAVVKLPSGKVRFSVGKLKGCCGVGLICHVDFYIKPDKQYLPVNYLKYLSWNYLNDGMITTHKRQFKSLYKEFHNYIVSPQSHGTGQHPYDLDRPCLMMTDFVGGQIYEFCKHNKWKMVKPFYNSNSGNDVVVFTLDKGHERPKYSDDSGPDCC